MSDRIPILLDTDIGDDIDDAVALAYLLNQPRADLIGITTVFRCPGARAALADAVCRAAGREDIPIHPGAAGLIGDPWRGDRSPPPQAEVLPRWPHREDRQPNTAIEFMRRTIRGRPGEIILLSIGPLTNVGLLFATDPDLAGMLRGYCAMCGAFFPQASEGKPEWNARCDPEATRIAYAAPVRQHVSVGLDVTSRCRLAAAEARERLCAGVLHVVAEMVEVWFRSNNAIWFHDPLAAALVFEPDLCSLEAGRVAVAVGDPETAGATGFRAEAEGPHRVAADVRTDAFFEHCFATLGV